MKNLNLFSLNNKKKILENQYLQLLAKDKIKKNVLKVIIICEGKILLFGKNKLFLDINKITNFKSIIKKFIFLSKSNNNIYLGLSLNYKQIESIPSLKNYSLFKIREVLGIIDKGIISLCTSLYCLDYWHNNNKYCSKCSSKNIIVDSGHALVCSNKECKKKIFPRIDPTVIMLVYNKNKILLARNANWPEKLYSCLAGFCEMNESLEETVKRETFEEVGLKVNNISYLFSQFWPFPNNLMIGFKAEATSLKLNINEQEIDKAIWVTKSQLINLKKSKEILLPKKHAIAYCLIHSWLNS